MNTIRRKIWRDVWSRKARTLLVSSSIFMGVLGVIALISTGELLLGQLEEDLDTDVMPQSEIFLPPLAAEDAATTERDAIVETAAAFPGVQTVEGWVRQSLFWQKAGQTGFVEANLRSFSVPLQNKQLNPLTLIDGEFPQPGQKGLVIERRMAEVYDLAVGDEVIVRVLSQLQGNPLEAANIPQETWTISGIVFHPYIFDNKQLSTYAQLEDFTYLTGMKQYALLQVRFDSLEQGQDSAEAFQEYLEANSPYNIDFVPVQDPADNELLSNIRTFSRPIYALAMLAMLVASFLVVTVISTIVAEQRKQIGVLKSLGATRWEIMQIYIGIAFIYGLLGTIPAVALGIPAGFKLTQAVAPLADVYLENFMMSPLAVAIGAVLGMVTPLLAAVLPVLSGTNVTIREAMTDLGIAADYGKGRLSRLIKGLPGPVSLRQALANIYQKRGRLALTGFTLTLAAGAFMGISAAFMSLNNVIAGVYDTYNVDLAITPSQVSADNIEQYSDFEAMVLSEVEGVEGVFPSYDLGVTILDETPTPTEDEGFFVFLTGFDPATDSIQFDLIDGEGWSNDPNRRGIVLTKGVAELLNKQVGDSLQLQHDEQTLALEVIGIDSFPYDRAFARWQDAAALGGATQPDQVWLRFNDHSMTGAEVSQQIGSIRETLMERGIVSSFDNLRAEAEEGTKQMFQIGLIFNIASLVMGLVGAVGLLTMLFISVFERQREIGVMRSIGASSTTVAAQFLGEGLLTGSIAWIIGLPLSYLIGIGLINVLDFADLGFRYPLLAPLLGLVGMGVIASVASLAPSLAAARKTVADILRYQ